MNELSQLAKRAHLPPGEVGKGKHTKNPALDRYWMG